MPTNHMKYLDMTLEQIDMEIAVLVNQLQDISDAVDKSFTITTTPDKNPVILIDGEVNNRLAYGTDIWKDLPGFEGTMRAVATL